MTKKLNWNAGLLFCAVSCFITGVLTLAFVFLFTKSLWLWFVLNASDVWFGAILGIILFIILYTVSVKTTIKILKVDRENLGSFIYLALLPNLLTFKLIEDLIKG